MLISPYDPSILNFKTEEVSCNDGIIITQKRGIKNCWDGRKKPVL